MLAGALFPWILYRWLGVAWGKVAGLIDGSLRCMVLCNVALYLGILCEFSTAWFCVAVHCCPN